MPLPALVEPGFGQVRRIRVAEREAREIERHKCVVSGMKGSLHHLHTRRFPVQPDELILEAPFGVDDSLV